jgi:predicted helicase
MQPVCRKTYRLGSRSALDWIIDQYQIKGDSDSNREYDPGYIVRLIGHVVRVSIETQRIV